MRTLHISVNNKVATYQQRDGRLVCGNSDYQITFTFDDEWDDYENKTARFIWNGKYVDVAFSGSTVAVPSISKATLLKVGVYAGELSTTTSASIPCVFSVLCDDSIKGSADNLADDSFVIDLSGYVTTKELEKNYYDKTAVDSAIATAITTTLNTEVDV